MSLRPYVKTKADYDPLKGALHPRTCSLSGSLYRYDGAPSAR
jgi:hypothetical protein